MKKFFAIAIIAASLTACGGETKTEETTGDSTSTVTPDTTTAVTPDTTKVGVDTTTVDTAKVKPAVKP